MTTKSRRAQKPGQQGVAAPASPVGGKPLPPPSGPETGPGGHSGKGGRGSDYGAQALGSDGRRRVDGARVVLQNIDPHNPARKHLKVTTQNVVDAYYENRVITLPQWRAANQLRSAFWRARLDTVKISNLLGTGGGRDSLGDDGVGVHEARLAYRDMMAAVGAVGGKALYWIVLANLSARDFAHKENLKRDDGLGVLKLALSVLAEYLGLLQAEKGLDRPGADS